MNVHPTKQEVHFLHEEEIFRAVRDAIEAALETASESRTLNVAQSLLPGASVPIGAAAAPRKRAGSSTEAPPPKKSKKTADLASLARPGSRGATRAEVPDHKLVRASTSQQRGAMDVFVSPVSRIVHGEVIDEVDSRPKKPIHAPLDLDMGAYVASSRMAPRQRVATTTEAVRPQDKALVAPEAVARAIPEAAAAIEHVQPPPPAVMAEAATPLPAPAPPAPKAVDLTAMATPPPPAPAAPAAQSGPVPASRMPRLEDPHLTSVRDLVKGLEGDRHYGLQQLFENHIFVGSVSGRFAVVQHETKLYLVDTRALSTQLCYESALRRIGQCTPLAFKTPIKLEPMMRLGLDVPNVGWRAFATGDGDAEMTKESVAALAVSRLCEHAPMLADYFCLDIDVEAKVLRSLPVLIAGYVPEMTQLPLFPLQLACNVDWSGETACFTSISRILADFYALREAPWERAARLESTALPSSGSSSSGSSGKAANAMDSLARESATPRSDGSTPEAESATVKEAKRALSLARRSLAFQQEHFLFPALRTFTPPVEFASNGCVVQIAALESLYKIFERC